MRELVALARANGRSWGEIGISLGVSRQAVRERFSEKLREVPSGLRHGRPDEPEMH
jgi:DNA-binding Lrp family transcriptional regulator